MQPYVEKVPRGGGIGGVGGGGWQVEGRSKQCHTYNTFCLACGRIQSVRFSPWVKIWTGGRNWPLHLERVGVSGEVSSFKYIKGTNYTL